MSVNSKQAKMVRLGDYIELVNLRNSKLIYGVNDVRGCSNNKEIQPTKADVSNRSFKKFFIVQPNEFVFNRRTTRMGERLGLGYNNSEQTFIFTEDYVCFRVREDAELLPDYLYMFFLRTEFDRYARYDSWGSATEFFNWSSMCDVNIKLPSLELQQKAIDTYYGLQALAEQNEALIQPLKEACQAYIVDCKKKYPEVELGEFIEIYDEKNNDAKSLPFYGINKDKSFMPTIANTQGLDNSKYKVVKQDVFVFSGMQTGRDVCIRLALYSKNDSILVSPAYTTFVVKDKSRILPQYLFLQFNRFEMDRYGWFLSDSSVRSNLDWEEFCRIKVPVPPLDVQQAIVNLYNCAEEAKKISDMAREKMKILSPALVQKAVNG